MKKIIALIFAFIVATVAFGVTASAVEVTKPEIPTVTMPEVPTVTMPEIHTLQEIPQLPTKPEIPTATKPEIHTLQEIPTVTIPAHPSQSEPTTNPADTEIPATGSNVVVPVIALLVLAGGATIAVKAKKED